MKSAAVLQADLSQHDRIRALLAFSLCVDAVYDEDLLDKWSSLYCVEAVVACERAFGVAEIEDDELLRCRSIGDLVRAVERKMPQEVAVAS